MESTKLNQYGQLVLTQGHKKAIVMRHNSRKWTVARGWASELTLTGERSAVSSKATALSYARDWINDQG